MFQLQVYRIPVLQKLPPTMTQPIQLTDPRTFAALCMLWCWNPSRGGSHDFVKPPQVCSWRCIGIWWASNEGASTIRISCVTTLSPQRNDLRGFGRFWHQLTAQIRYVANSDSAVLACTGVTSAWAWHRRSSQHKILHAMENPPNLCINHHKFLVLLVLDSHGSKVQSAEVALYVKTLSHGSWGHLGSARESCSKQWPQIAVVSSSKARRSTEEQILRQHDQHGLRDLQFCFKKTSAMSQVPFQFQIGAKCRPRNKETIGIVVTLEFRHTWAVSIGWAKGVTGQPLHLDMCGRLAYVWFDGKLKAMKTMKNWE